MDYKEAFEKFERLKQEQKYHLSKSEEKLQKWFQFKKDYNALKDRLLSLPDELSFEIMVPISKKGFMPGKLIHTNEILVLVGDNWMIERSAKQSGAMIDRRLLGIEEHIKKLNEEKNKFVEAIKWTESIMQEKSEFVNIEEKLESTTVAEKEPLNKKRVLTEEEKKELRKKQQERALEVQKKIDLEIKKNSKIEDSDDDDDEDGEEDEKDEEHKEGDDKIEKELEDSVSLMEKMGLNLKSMIDEEKKGEALGNISSLDRPKSSQDEPNRAFTPGKFYFEDMLSEYERTIDRNNNEKIGNMMKTKSSSKVKWSDLETSKQLQNVGALNTAENDDESGDDTEDTEEETESESEDQGEYTKVIHIKHTESSQLDQVQRNLNVSRDKSSLDNPGDIYRVFFQPKSILKTESKSIDTVVPEKQVDFKAVESEQVTETTKADKIKFEPHKAFTGVIVEKNQQIPETAANNQPPTKRISKFKASKM